MTRESARRLQPLVALGAVSVAALWALCYPLVTVAVEYAPPLSIAALRAALAGFVLLVVGTVSRRPSPRARDWPPIVALGLTSTALGFGGMFLAGGRISPGIAEVVANAQPFVAAVLAYFALGEPLKRHQMAGMAVSFVGIALVATPTWSGLGGAKVSVTGLAFVGAAALGVATGNVLMKRFSGRLDPVLATGWQLVVGALLLSVVAVATEPIATIQWTAEFVGALLGLAIPGTAIAFVVWFGLLARAPLNSLNTFSFLTPVFGLTLAWWFFDERLSVLQLAGALLVVTGAGLAAIMTRAAE